MMRATLRQFRLHLWLAIVLLILLSAAAAHLALQYQNEAEMRAQAAAAERIVGLENRRAALLLQIEQARQNQVEINFWDAADVNEGIALLQSALRRLGSESGLTFRSTSVLPAQEVSGVVVMRLRIEVEARLDTALSFIRAVEEQDPVAVFQVSTMRRVAQVAGSREGQPVILWQMEIAAPLVVPAEDAE